MKKFVYIIICLWLAVICTIVTKQEFTLKTGREVLLKTVPVDPRDLLRGDYVILNYEVAQIPSYYSYYGENKTVYVILQTDKENVAHFVGITDKQPKNLFLKGKTGKCQTIVPLWRNGRCVSFGIESYFVKEGAGKDLERDLRNGALVKVAIDKNGNAKVKGFVQKDASKNRY